MMKLTRRQRQILEMLELHPPGRCLNRKQLRTNFNFMQNMYFLGLVQGSASRDDKGYGNYPETNFWEITTKGRETIAALPPLRTRIKPTNWMPLPAPPISGTFQANPAPLVSTSAENATLAPQRGVNAGETDHE